MALAASSTATAGVTFGADSREVHAEASVTPHTMPASETASSTLPLATFLDSVMASSPTEICDLVGVGGNVIFTAITSAFQDSHIHTNSIPAFISVTGSADADHRIFISAAGSFFNASLELHYDSGTGANLVYSQYGTGGIAYDQVLGPGTFTLVVEALADEHNESSEFDIDFEVLEPVAPPPGAGRVPQLTMNKGPLFTNELHLVWLPSCSADDDTCAVFSGDLGFFDSHTQETCSTGGATSLVLPQPSENKYYLVVLRDGSSEGSYGTDSDGVERLVGIVNCGTQNIVATCP